MTLPDQSLRVLEALVERPGHLVRRDELCERLWPDQRFVERDQGLNAAVRRLRRALGEVAMRPRFVGTIRSCGYRFLGTLKASEGPEVPEALAAMPLAVLPFAWLEGDEKARLLAEGLTEELIYQLSRCPFLRVVARTSVYALGAGRERRTARQIGRLLSVRGIVEGAVRSAEDRYRVTVHVSDAREGVVLWSRAYDVGESTLHLQVAIARDLVGGLRIRIPLPGPAPGATTTRPEAYRLFLEGLGQLHKLAPIHLEQSLDLFERAAAADPGYVLPLCGIADACLMQLFFGSAEPRRVREQAQRAVARALRLDPRNHAALASRGAVAFLLDWDWAAAESDLQRSIEVNPGYAQAREWYAHLLFVLRRFEEAARELAIARKLDPLAPSLRALQGFLLLWTRDDAGAERQLLRAIEREPFFFETYWPLGLLYLRRRDFDRAIEHLQQASRLAGDPALVMADLGAAHAWAGRRAEARRILESLASLPRPHIPCYGFALLHTALDEPERALDWLERGVEERDPMMVYIGLDNCDVLAPLRGQRRFASVLRRMRLPT